jgi:hypothetical protein
MWSPGEVLLGLIPDPFPSIPIPTFLAAALPGFQIDLSESQQIDPLAELLRGFDGGDLAIVARWSNPDRSPRHPTRSA